MREGGEDGHFWCKKGIGRILLPWYCRMMRCSRRGIGFEGSLVGVIYQCYIMAKAKLFLEDPILEAGG